MSNSAEDYTWKQVLAGERDETYFKDLLGFVETERSNGKIIYPKNADVFNALTFTPFESVKVVIIGQDPYHGPNQAHGLCFSVKAPTPPPPSLVNIFKELKTDVDVPIHKSGDLEGWAKQGVLMLNAVMTVEAGKPGSHANKGWERFTDKVISELNARREGIVFLLWGAYAEKKASFVDKEKHIVFSAPHPSPFSANRGFFGCKHFSKTNKELEKQEKDPIDWSAVT